MSREKSNCGVRRIVNFPVYRSLGIAFIEARDSMEIRSATGSALVPTSSRVGLLVSAKGIEDLHRLRAMRADDLHAISFAGEYTLTDYHMEYLSGMTALTELSLAETLVSDRSIPLLSPRVRVPGLFVRYLRFFTILSRICHFSGLDLQTMSSTLAHTNLRAWLRLTCQSKESLLGNNLNNG